ncbi:hypothetical protein SH584_07395 [Sphingomonas sp. LY29]|uniref:hypothetical protein n=1 Tax=Sphingomonas sp. LY29 TaxID=3095341 RepID=UPI002D78A332|nr:hypothetical protein [Sphingomonas sp. LY29]WRP24887.1 hypothetical protein SH584_07395 [Sphingomonas sp. LY29]
MSVHVDPKLLVATRQLAQPPAAPRACTDRTFNLPTSLHAGFFGLFLAYLGVTAIGFPHPEMILPMAIFVIFTVGFYVVPMLWATMGPENPGRAMSLRRLFDEGVDTFTGRSSGGEAAVQVLVLPVLILAWGIAVVLIAAFA